MSDGFSDMILRAQEFFTKLKADNTKPFYEEHKAFYTAEIKKPAELMADLFAEDIARHTGKPHGPKVFRIHRDVRFSKDKTPYNTHLHMLWQQPGDAPSPAWFFGASPDYMTFLTGIPGLKGEALTRYRQMIDREGDEISDLIATAQSQMSATLSDFGADPLKRVPKPYDPEHPHAELLKRKGLILSAPIPDGWQDDGILTVLNRLVPQLLPFWRALDRAFPGGT